MYGEIGLPRDTVYQRGKQYAGAYRQPANTVQPYTIERVQTGSVQIPGDMLPYMYEEPPLFLDRSLPHHKDDGRSFITEKRAYWGGNIQRASAPYRGYGPAITAVQRNDVMKFGAEDQYS